MSGFDCYQTYLAVNNHFKQRSYDFFKYHGKINARQTSYEARKDKYFFEKASRKFKRDDFIKYLVANFTKGNTWIGELLTPKTEIDFKKWRKRIESLTYNFKEELSHIHEKEEDFNRLFVVENGRHPYAFRLYQRGNVSLETLVFLDDLVHFTKHWSKHDDMILNEVIELIQKYRPFLYHFTNANNEKLKQIVLETYS
ncbi:MAG: hypothetical protein VW270_15890 [Candidatus Poseidoniales archaeon]